MIEWTKIKEITFLGEWERDVYFQAKEVSDKVLQSLKAKPEVADAIDQIEKAKEIVRENERLSANDLKQIDSLTEQALKALMKEIKKTGRADLLSWLSDGFILYALACELEGEYEAAEDGLMAALKSLKTARWKKEDPDLLFLSAFCQYRLALLNESTGKPQQLEPFFKAIDFIEQALKLAKTQQDFKQIEEFRDFQFDLLYRLFLNANFYNKRKIPSRYGTLFLNQIFPVCLKRLDHPENCSASQWQQCLACGRMLRWLMESYQKCHESQKAFSTACLGLVYNQKLFSQQARLMPPVNRDLADIDWEDYEGGLDEILCCEDFFFHFYLEQNNPDLARLALHEMEAFLTGPEVEAFLSEKADYEDVLLEYASWQEKIAKNYESCNEPKKAEEWFLAFIDTMKKFVSINSTYSDYEMLFEAYEPLIAFYAKKDFRQCLSTIEQAEKVLEKMTALSKEIPEVLEERNSLVMIRFEFFLEKNRGFSLLKLNEPQKALQALSKALSLAKKEDENSLSRRNKEEMELSPWHSFDEEEARKRMKTLLEINQTCALLYSLAGSMKQVKACLKETERLEKELKQKSQTRS